MKRILTFVLTVLVAALASPTGALACAACFGKSDSNMANSVNAGIFSLLAVIATVLIGRGFLLCLPLAPGRRRRRSRTKPAKILHEFKKPGPCKTHHQLTRA